MAKLTQTIAAVTLYLLVTFLLIFFGSAVLVMALYDWASQQVGPLAAGFALAFTAFCIPILTLVLTRWYLTLKNKKQQESSTSEDQDHALAQLEQWISSHPILSVSLALVSGWFFDSNPRMRDDVVKYALLYQSLTKE